MEQQAKALKNAYLKDWRAKNKDKVKKINDRYWEKKAQNLNCEGERKQ